MKPLTTLLTIAVTLSCLNSTAQADRKSREEEKARQQRLERQFRDLEYILKHESDGTLSDRQAALTNMISTGVAPDEAYWQAGYIKKGDQWVSVRDRWLTPEQEQKVDGYAKVRTEFADSDEDHYKLAQWCAENGFDAQAYAHLKAVLLNHPDHAGLRQLLGYQKIGNRWMNAEDYEAVLREAERLAEELQQWGPQVSEIGKGLNSPNRLQQHRAKTRLKEITEAAAISAMELILLPSSDVAAAACVDQLCRIDHRRSSIALCKAAMFLSESASGTKQAAVEELKTRPLDDFVPVLLGNMQTPLTAEISFYTRTNWEYSNGVVGYQRWRHLALGRVRIANQTMLENRTYQLGIVLRDIDQISRIVTASPRGLRIPTNSISPRALQDVTAHDHSLTNVFKSPKSYAEVLKDIETASRRETDNRELFEGYLKLNNAVRARNENIDLYNESVTSLLAVLTNVSQHESPEYWWNWWCDRIEVDASQRLNRIVNEVIIGEVSRQQSFGVGGDGLPSCFVAGTPVWTDRGPRPIEQLHVGDMALTQNVETGELMYRPIIRTTTRQPKPLVTIDLGAEEITSTGGHPFFVPGEGWVRARELKAGQFLHTPTGTIKIDSVTETPDEETYNLVIDGFHTYFVGMSQALVHDVSIASPTDAVVPGLLDR